ncbi:succinate dehydrogenase subunit 4, mitochondrial-like [Typha angustifolia]|uniref:succinate dehydrogenase subunit 4, mitochondrial-like n=1 Tax=Typha angustifolia TaxID=59011 RepID=UPI003C2B2F5D
MAMASGLLRSRPKTLTLARFLLPSFSSSTFSSASIDPIPRSAPLLDPARRFLYGSRKILEYGQTSQLYSFRFLSTAGQVLPGHSGVNAQSGNIALKDTKKAIVTEESTCASGKEEGCAKVLAFSPLEGTVVKERKSGLGLESLKIKRMELSQRITYPLVPALLLISKTNFLTSVLVFSVYWQIYGFFKEIILDYVHHEVTRKWVFVYFSLLLLILAKDTIVYFNLV